MRTRCWVDESLTSAHRLVSIASLYEALGTADRNTYPHIRTAARLGFCSATLIGYISKPTLTADISRMIVDAQIIIE